MLNHELPAGQRPLVLFGPQLGTVDRTQALIVSNKIAANPNLGFINDVLHDLTDKLNLIRRACHDLDDDAVKLQLELLRSAISTGSIPEKAVLSSAFLAPWTTIRHAVDYAEVGTVGDAQGFCVGFLAAAAASTSSNEEQRGVNFSKAINLAICIGAVVDAERDTARTYSVQWHSLASKLALERTLKMFPEAYISCFTDHDRVTVTIRAADGPQCLKSLRECGLRFAEVGLSERYHLSQRRIDKILALCSMEDRLKLPDASTLVMPLRSNMDGEVIAEGSLSAIAVRSILVEPSHWFEVAAAAVARSPQTAIVQLGLPSLPRSLMKVGTTVPKPSTREKPSYEPIAVIGVACRYPKADSIADFWKLLEAGGCAVSPLPKSRFDLDQWDRQPNVELHGNFIDQPAAFDHRFFAISGREAKSMDPQQRLALQVAYETLESAGYASKVDNSGQDVGCFLGVGSVDYETNVASEKANSFSATGTLRAFISGRISHHFGWTGPSITYDTACSSSAVAIHSACKAIQMGECSTALAGGVNVITAPSLFQNLMAASFLNQDGASRAFDADAGGYCRGEGAGLILLKPLSMALADNDFVLGVIKASGVNQGDNCTSITVPHSGSQSSLYDKVLSQARLAPRDVSYVEAHGTGTQVGDPIEYESIRKTFESQPRTGAVYVGSVKDNVGHTEAASGAAGLIKVLMMMRHHRIPKQANFSKLNPAIKPGNEVKISTLSQPWNSKNYAALINNYGAAGSNAAIVVESPSLDVKVTELPNSLAYLFKVSAHSEASLRKYVNVLSMHLRDHDHNTADLAFNLSVRYNPDHEFSYQWTSSDTYSLRHGLSIPESAVLRRTEPARPCILSFGGQGAKGPLASRELYDNSLTLQAYFSRCDAALSLLGLPSALPGIFGEKPHEDIVMAHAQIFVSQFAQAMTWLESGVKPAALIGHSFGQITALCVAAAISLEDALRLVVSRARLVRDAWGSESGAMASLEGPQQAVNELIAQSESPVEVACFNGPNSFVIAGPVSAVDALETAWKVSPGFVTRFSRLRNTHAYHSSLTAAILPGLKEVADTISFQPSKILVETCSPGSAWADVTADRIVEHTRNPVYFQQAVERLANEHSNAIWLEIGAPSCVLPMIRRVLKGSSSRQTYISAPTTLSSLVETVSSLSEAGVNATFWPFHRQHTQSFNWLPLPPYQFEDHSHWIECKPSVARAPVLDAIHADQPADFVSLRGQESSKWKFIINSDHDLYKTCVSGHAVCGQSLCPASLYCEMVVRGICKIPRAFDASKSFYAIEDLNIIHPLTLSPGGSLMLELSSDASQVWSYQISTESDDTTVHARGKLLIKEFSHVQQRFSSLEVLLGSQKDRPFAESSNAEVLSGSVVYKVFSAVVDYASHFRGVRRVAAKDHEAMADVSLPQPQPEELNDCVCPPVALDNFLQVAGIHVNCLTSRRADDVYVCVGITGISQRADFIQLASQKLKVYSNFRHNPDGQVVNDIYVMSSSDKLLVLIEGARFAAVSLKSLSRTLSKLNSSRTDIRTTTLDHRSTKPRISSTVDSSSDPDMPDEESTDSASYLSTEATETDEDDQRVCVAWNEENLRLELRLAIGRVLEIPVEQISPSASLSALGIDSLLSSEVAKEIGDSFGVKFSRNDLTALADVPAVLAYISKRSSPPTPAEVQKPEVKPSGVRAHSNLVQPEPREDGRAPTSSREQTDSGIGAVALQCFSSIRNTYDVFVERSGLAGFSETVHPAQDQLVTAYIAEAFRSLGSDLSNLRPGDELPPMRYDRQHEKAMNQYLLALQESGLICRAVDGTNRWLRTPDPLSPKPSTELLPSLLRHFPRYASEHRLLSTTGSKLAACLTGAADPVDLLFRDAEARALLADVYTNAPMFRAGTECLASYLVSVLKSARGGGGGGGGEGGRRPLRILELGAGTGGTTAFLLEALTTASAEISGEKRAGFRYTFTDLSPSLVAAARKKFAAYGAAVEFRTADVEVSPPPELCGKFDVVLSTNCIHATRDLGVSASNIHAMLKPNSGVLCLVELNRNLFWFDLVFGLLEGWWRFADGRTHALIGTEEWEKRLRGAGFGEVMWTKGMRDEAGILSVIVASKGVRNVARRETVVFKEVEHSGKGEGQRLPLEAEIHYPLTLESGSAPPRKVALLIHGGGHVLLSRHAVRSQQINHLLSLGFLPVSVDYRLCPETTLKDGPMVDVRDAWAWARQVLPRMKLARKDIEIDTGAAVVVGWSTGGLLAMSLGWTAAEEAGVEPPSAALVFYSPSDYEDGFWRERNVPSGCEGYAAANDHAEVIKALKRDLHLAMEPAPITAYEPTGTQSNGDWMELGDARSRVLVGMNLGGKHLEVLLRGPKAAESLEGGEEKLDVKEIREISARFWIDEGVYTMPTYLIHGTEDDLIPWEQAQGTYDALVRRQVDAEIRIVRGAGEHLFDTLPGWQENPEQKEAVWTGYQFLKKHSGRKTATWPASASPRS